MTTTPLKTDAEVLANRFNLAELRRELHHAEVNCLPDWPDSEYWYWYKDVAVEAIAIKKQTQPKLKLIAGHIDVESIKARTDILTIVESYGLKPRKAGHTFKSCCPFHTEKTPLFVIYPDENRFHYWSYRSNVGEKAVIQTQPFKLMSNAEFQDVKSNEMVRVCREGIKQCSWWITRDFNDQSKSYCANPNIPSQAKINCVGNQPQFISKWEVGSVKVTPPPANPASQSVSFVVYPTTAAINTPFTVSGASASSGPKIT